MGKQLLNFQDSYYTVEFTFGSISFLLSFLSILLLYLTRRKSGFTYFNGLVVHQFIAQLTFDWCNVMTFFCFLKGFGNVDDDYYYDYYDDYLDKYREDWFVAVSFFYQFGGIQTSIFAAIIMGVITYMVVQERLLDLKRYYPYFFVLGFVIPFILSLCRILFFYPLTDKYYFSGPHGPSALYYIINVYRNLAILFMIVCNFVLYRWLHERRDMNPQILRLVKSVQWYPVIEILVRFVYYMELIDDVQGNKNEKTTRTFTWLVTIFNSLQGSAYFLVFLLRDEEAYSYLVNSFKNLCRTGTANVTEIEIQNSISQPKSIPSKRRISVQGSFRGDAVYGDDDSDIDETECSGENTHNPLTYT